MGWIRVIALVLIGWCVVSVATGPFIGSWLARKFGGDDEWTSGDSGGGSTGAGTTE
jgi:hypothetical protein